jgi:hypothetical protein
MGRDATLRRDSRGFDHEQPRTAIEQIGPMHQMPIIGATIFVASVLAHGGHDDAVGDGQGAAWRVESER